MKRQRPVAWQPQPGPQLQFCRDQAQECLYGGAAGGGKTDALLGSAARYIDRPGYTAALFRRTFTRLSKPGGMLDRSYAIYSQLGGTFKQGTYRWEFPSGAVIQFSHLEHADDVHQHQGAAYTFIGFDEVTEFEERQYLYLLSRCRSVGTLANGKPIPKRIRATCNPEPCWVKDRFTKLKPGEVRYFKRQFDADTETDASDPSAVSRQYIPARLSDNPALTANNPEYESFLDGLPEVERRRLKEGDWDAYEEGDVLHRSYFSHRCKSAPSGLQWFRYWDLALTTNTANSATASVAIAFDADGCLWIRDPYCEWAEWPDVYQDIKRITLAEGIGTQQGIEDKMHGIAAVQQLRRDPDMRGIDFRRCGVKGDKRSRALAWSRYGEDGKIRVVDGPGVDAFIGRAVVFKGDGKTFDDEVDSVSGGVAMAARGTNKIEIFGMGRS